MSARIRTLTTTLAVALSALLSLAGASAATAAAPVWEIDGHHGPTVFEPGDVGVYSFTVTNVGDAVAAGPVSLEIELPQGVTTRAQPIYGEAMTWFPGFGAVTPAGWSCASSAPGESSLGCTALLDPVRPGGLGLGTLKVFVSVAADAVGPLSTEATVSGGGALPVSDVQTVSVGPAETGFGVQPGSFEADAFDKENVAVRQAGSHPFRAYSAFDFKATTDLVINPENTNEIIPSVIPNGNLRNIELRLPRGFVGNPEAATVCGGADFGRTSCPTSSQVGTVQVTTRPTYGGFAYPGLDWLRPVNRLPAPEGTLARFGFTVDGRPILIDAGLDPDDYSVVARVHDINETLAVFFQRVTLWGNPADPVHDPERWDPETGTWGDTFEGQPKPFLSLPTECNVADSAEIFRFNSWRDPAVNAADGLKSEPVELSGCDQLEFEPTVDVKPTTNVADAPTGLEFEMKIPQNEDVNGLATAHLRDAVVRLPEGMTVNPPSAEGLGACSMSQVGIGADGIPTSTREANGSIAPTPANCPDDSKLGTLEAISPAIDHPLKGEIYLAEQNANPFNSLLALYLVIENPETGLLVKLPGRVDPDPQTGQLTATFRNNPQLPVEDLRLKFFEGPRAALKTPSACGAYETTGTLTPWSAPEAPSVPVASSFELTQGPAGGACLPTGGAAPNNPSFSAGTLDPTAKAFSPFVLRLARADGTQQLKAIDTTLPKGLVAKLAGTTYCSDAALAAAASKSGKAEQALPSCPSSSHVGVVNVGAGAGSTPLYVQGQAYLAGPYKGAPLSLAIITPAVAGPFDLGTVVVRTALHVNSETAQVRAVSDEIPHILQGIPLNVRSVALKMDRPQFTLNPTSCDPMSIDGSALTLFNQSAALTNHFQLGECNRLGFKPQLAIKLKGGTKRGGHPALTATVKTRPNDANIRKTVVALPHSEFLAQDHIRTICTRVQFAAEACPQGSVYGTASAITPLLDEPLTGNVYLRSSSNPLPDMVIALRGKIDVDLVGRIDSDRRGGIRTSFETVPDAPVSSFTLKMAGGKKSLLENSKNLCASTNKATAQMSAQNGMAFDSRPVVKSAGCKGKARKGGKKGKPGKKRGGKR